MFKKMRKIWIHGDQIAKATTVLDMVDLSANVSKADVSQPFIYELSIKLTDKMYEKVLRMFYKYGVTIFN